MIGSITIVKMSITPKKWSKESMESRRIPMGIFHRTRTSNPEICRDHKRPWIPKQSWERRKKVEISCYLFQTITKL